MNPLFAVARHGIRSWWKDRRSLLVSLVTPVLLFLLLASFFAGRSEGMPSLETGWVDLDQSQVSHRLARILKSDGSLHLIPAISPFLKSENIASIQQQVKAGIRQGKLSLALVVLPGFQDQVVHFHHWKTSLIRVYFGPTEKTRAKLLQGLLTKAGFLLIGETWGRSDEKELLETKSLTSSQRVFLLDLHRAFQDSYRFMQTRRGSFLEESFLPISFQEVRGKTIGNVRLVQPLAGVAIIFLLFSVMRAGSVVLEERQSGTLHRLLASPVTIPQFLVGKLLSITANGMAQVGVICLVGWIFFHIPIFRQPVSLGLMIFATAACAASFGLFMTTFCRTSDQVFTIAACLILTMSLLGGSIIPDFLLPHWAQKLSRFTLNEWAMKGFLNVLVYDQGLRGIFLPLSMLSLMAAGLMGLTFLILPRQLFKQPAT